MTAISGYRIHRQNQQTVEAIGHVERVRVGGLDEGFFGAVQVQIRADQVSVFQPVRGRLQDVPIAESRLIANAVAQPPNHLVVEVISDGDAVELKIDQRAGRRAAARFVLAEVQWRAFGGWTSAD